jgi:hypothetical protein
MLIFFINLNNSAIMKGLVSILIWSVFFLIATGQAPESLYYQAIVHNAEGEIV